MDQLDRIDRELVSLLRANSRTSTSALGRALGLSRTTGQDRINRLYAPNSDVPPAGFDPLDAGERWDDEY